MAEVITRFKVEDAQHDRAIRKIKRQYDDLVKSLGVNLKAFSKIGVASAAAAGAFKVMGDAMKKSEGLTDSWNATIEASTSVYKSFLNTLNTGNFSGFLSGLREISKAAREAYYSLDNLGTYQAFSSRGNAKNRAAYAEALAAFKESPTASNKAMLSEANTAIVNELNEQAALVAKAYTDGMMKLALQQGLKGTAADNFVSMFRDKSWYELVAAKNGYARGEGLKALGVSWNGYEVQGHDLITRTKGGVVESRRAMTENERAQFEFSRALSELTDAEIQAIQSLGAQEFMLKQAAADQQRSFLRMSGGNGKVETFKNDYKWMGGVSRSVGFNTNPVDGAKILDSNLPKVAADIERMNISTQYARKEAFALSMAWQDAASSIALAGAALQGIENPAAKVAGMLAEAVANIALGFAQASKNQGKDGNVWEWIAASISGVTTMVSTIAAIKSATSGYAQGGIVGSLNGSMNSPSGDNIVARLNSGEGVLTRTGIENAGRILSGNSLLGGLHLEAYVSGESLRIALENNNRRRGGSRGEYAIGRS